MATIKAGFGASVKGLKKIKMYSLMTLLTKELMVQLLVLLKKKHLIILLRWQRVLLIKQVRLLIN